MKTLYLALFLMMIAPPAIAIDDPVSKVAGVIRQGKINELSAMMAESVEISITGTDSTCSKTQAENILTTFFKQHKPLSVKVLHKINSNPQYHFGVLLINTNQGVYRIALTFREVNGSFKLIELRIETEKVK